MNKCVCVCVCVSVCAGGLFISSVEIYSAQAHPIRWVMILHSNIGTAQIEHI